MSGATRRYDQFWGVVASTHTLVVLALSAGAPAGLLVQVPAGHFADLRGPRKVLQTLTFGAGAAILGLLFARSVWALCRSWSSRC